MIVKTATIQLPCDGCAAPITRGTRYFYTSTDRQIRYHRECLPAAYALPAGVAPQVETRSERRHIERQVRCDECGAEVGEWCVSQSGRACPTHQARLEALAVAQALGKVSS